MTFKEEMIKIREKKFSKKDISKVITLEEMNRKEIEKIVSKAKRQIRRKVKKNCFKPVYATSCIVYDFLVKKLEQEFQKEGFEIDYFLSNFNEDFVPIGELCILHIYMSFKETQNSDLKF